jgi:Icc-related predicted phosphoesterase
MKILAFSDLHRDLEQGAQLVEMSAEADVVIGAGDFASVHEGLEETIEALSGIETPTVLVPGNNETVEALREAAAGWSAARVLHGEATTIEGTEFFGLGAGIPVTPWDWSFDLDDEAATEMLSSCPEGAVLVLHSPPKDHCDSAGAYFARSKRSAPASPSAATSTSPGAAKARSARRRSATSAPKAPGSRSSRLGGGRA